MTKNRSRKPSNDSTTQLDGEFSCSRKFPPCFLGHGTESDFVAKFIHGKLPDSIGNLSVIECVVSMMHDQFDVHTELAEYR